MHRMQRVTATGDQYVDLSEDVEMSHLVNHQSNNEISVIWLGRRGIVILIVTYF